MAVITAYLVAIGFALGGCWVMASAILGAAFAIEETAAAAVGIAMAVIPATVAFSIERITRNQRRMGRETRRQKTPGGGGGAEGPGGNGK